MLVCLLFALRGEGRAQDAVDFAKAQIGKPYEWAGTGPDAFDCSGLTKYAYSQAGIPIPRTSVEQSQAGTPVLGSLQRGDLVFFATIDSTPGVVTHVGIYEGANVMINAFWYGIGVRRDDISSDWWAPRFVSARRIVSPMPTPTPTPTPTPGTWTATADLNFGRLNHTATLLANGKVLVAGGSSFRDNAPGINKAELYDPATESWNVIGDLSFARRHHTATLLQSGKVLVVGGSGSPLGVVNKTAELYDPASGTWSTTGDLNFARLNHTATLLPNGLVLVAGGSGFGDVSNKAELYDPGTGVWSATGDLHFAHSSHTATLLPNGLVLVAGGFNSPNKAELYDPGTHTWGNTADLNFGRYAHTSTLLPNGQVLAAGGFSSGISFNQCELYDPAAGSWSNTGDLNFRLVGEASLLLNGRVLLAGGFLNKAELFDPAMGTWSNTGDLNFARASHTATLLPNGRVLVTGGQDGPVGLKKAELYNPN